MNTIDVNNLNEFVDWVDGVNSVTGATTSGVDEENRISGKSIRELILSKLKVPFVTNETDLNKDKIYFFSSEYAKNLWKTYTDKTSILYNEDKAADLVLYSMDLPAVYKITGLKDLSSTRYIIEGNTTSQNAVLNFLLGIEDALGSPLQDGISLQYVILDESNNETLRDVRNVESGELGQTITRNIYQYLKPGRNNVQIEAVCNNIKAKTSTSFYIYLVRFNIQSNFIGYYSAIGNAAQTIPIQLSIDRTITSLNILTKVRIRDVENNTERDGIFFGGHSVDEYDGRESNFTRSLTLDVAANDLLPGRKYVMYITSEMVDKEGRQSFTSNSLLYEFEIQTSLEQSKRFINIAHSSSTLQTSSNPNSAGLVILKAVQYQPFLINWGYHTDITNGASEVSVQWAIRKGEVGNYTYTYLIALSGVKGSKPDQLRFIPNVSASHSVDNSFLVARISINGVLTDVGEFPIDITEKQLIVSESQGSLKLSAYGKTNSSDDKNQWVDQINNVTTTFNSAVPFDNTSGWMDNSLMLKGTDNYATINYCPFPSTVNDNPYNVIDRGCAFQIDFKPEYVSSESDPIITIGNSGLNDPRIIITPTSAAFYTGANPKIKTNFKSGERISLTFIFNKIDENSNDSGLLYIVNNGILERAAVIGENSIVDNTGRIKIGGTNSSVRVYSIRAYRTDIQVKQALANYMFDNLDNAELLSRNDVYGNQSTILYKELEGKLDIILITSSDKDASGLTNILNNASSKLNATVNIERHSTDRSKDFTITDCRIRNHGQSTLSYPITSMKIWTNKSNVIVNNVELTPNFQCSDQQYLGLAKNRYIMKEGAIPSNKFVLQANYADSSGAHNGALLRLIQDTWYNANFGTTQDPEYKLRTAPQLFASGAKISHNNRDLNEDGTWIEGLYNIQPGTTDKNGNSIYNSSKANKTWPEITGVQFPYDIRVSADSFPCTVFYQEAGKEKQLLGQYVFMDDKKSDYVYGERSIYQTKDLSDPFCLKVENSKNDKAANKVWDNKDVLQIEVVYPNSPLTGYCSKVVADRYEVDPNDDSIIRPVGNTLHSFRDIYQDGSGNNVSFYWEQHFELIYPDENDITGDKFAPGSAFRTKVEPFLSFLDWITDCKLNYSTATQWWSAGDYSSTQEAFEATAHDHLDMYKLAAYYIFFLRFGLVDSVERNALLKTYDGQHWHYEPWDMDIALGCANNGVIAYDPPLTRNKRKADGVSYVYSGRTQSQSNTLWDCLENWSYWADQLVPKVALALYDAGLTYDNAVAMFDNNYVNKWAETLYNDSGHFKYIDAASDPYWMQYLNGARTSHRHWWLSKSMNYYDAKWACGDFIKHSIIFRMRKNAGSGSVKLIPNAVTFFKGEYGQIGTTQRNPFGDGLYEAQPGTGVTIPATNITLDEKQQTFIFGANTIEELDMSDMLSANGSNIINIDLTGAYDKTLGSPIKVLKIGAPTTPNIYTNPNETSYSSRLSIAQNGIAAMGTQDGVSYDVLENTEHIDLIGLIGDEAASDTTSLNSILNGQGYDRKNVKSIYAMGCEQSGSFVSSSSGNKFTDLRLPDSVTSITMSNSSWLNISFWSTNKDLSTGTATYTKLTGIPASVNKVYFLGSTGRNKCSWDFIKGWIQSIEAEVTANNPGATEDEIEELLYAELATRTLTVNQAYWGTWTGETISYKDVVRLSKFKNETGGRNLKGYVRIHENNITSSQLVNLSTLFGPDVFNIGGTNSTLVIDNDSDIIRISSIDATVDSTTGYVNINEGNSITLSANKFLLSGDNILNAILSSGMSINDMETNKYYWSTLKPTTSPQDHSLISTWTSYYPPYANISVNDNTGRVILTANIGDGNDYTMYVGVFYKDSSNNLQRDEMRIDVTAATYPSGYIMRVYDKTTSNNESARQFLCSQAIADDIFNVAHSRESGSLIPMYVMYANNRKYEYKIEPQGNYTVPLVSLKYQVARLSGSSVASYTNELSYNELNIGDSERMTIGVDLYLKYTKDSTNNGISLVVDQLPQGLDMALYQVTATIKMGTSESSSVIKKVNIIVMNDSNIVLTGNSPLVLCIKDKYASLYAETPSNLYRSHLLSIYGTLSYNNASYNTITSVGTENGDSLFNYLKYVTALDFTGCSSLQAHSTNYSFSGMPNLTSLSFNGCANLNSVVDLSVCPDIQTVDFTGTMLGIKLTSANTAVTSVALGTPISVEIKNVSTMPLSGISDTSSSYLDSMELENITYNSSPIVFNVFDKLYNAPV